VGWGSWGSQRPGLGFHRHAATRGYIGDGNSTPYQSFKWLHNTKVLPCAAHWKID
jgi:hypothetical protein